MTTSIVTIHMVASVDMYIGRKDNDIAWMNTQDLYEKGINEHEIDVEAFLQGIDCYVMGAKTYEHALELGWPYGDKPVFVVTHRDLPRMRETVEFLQGDLGALVAGKLRPQYKNIWMVGGATLAREFIRLGLADEIRMTVLPVIIGEGLPFFDRVNKEVKLHLKDVTAYRNGMVELWYEIHKTSDAADNS